MIDMAKKRRQCRRRMLRVFGVILILIAALIAWAAIDSRNIDVTRFTVSGAPEAFSGFKIAQISDLHNAEFGTDNQKLIDILKSEAPDAIVITGDLIDARRTNTEIAESFARRCMEIADCYYVPGNHEARLGGTYDAFESALIADGVNVLRNGSVRIRKGMDAIRIVGVDDPAFAKASDAITNLDATLEALSSDDFTILLAHRPELIDEYSKWGIDLVLSGHAHGGQIRLPGIGGLYAPGQGFFPRYTSGNYTMGDTEMIVSRGIGNSAFPLRVNDRPEVVIVTLK